MDGGVLARRLRRAGSGAKLIAFSIHSDQEYVVRMARCGARGYVMKDAPAAKLVEAILRVHDGGLSFPPGMTNAILAPELKPPSDGARAALTAREREVLILLAEGLANKQVARKLSISVRTAETHREHLFRKLGLTSIAALTKYAIQQGLTPLSLPPEPGR
jgi:DNA-binding NarL/FixJ family response regulator